MASVSYTGYVVPVSEASMEDIIAEWEREMKGARARILNHLTSKIASQGDFLTKLVAPAIAGYGDYVNPEHPKSDTAKLKFRIKLGKAYPAWSSGVNSAFAENGIFETNVTAKKGKMVNAKYTVGAVGQKAVIGYNAVVKAIMAITGDSRLVTYIEPAKGDSLSGTPLNVFDADVAGYVKPLIVAPAVRACVFAHYANEAGMTSLRDEIITAFNGLSGRIITAFKKANATATLTLSWDTARYPSGSVKITASGTLP